MNIHRCTAGGCGGGRERTQDKLGPHVNTSWMTQLIGGCGSIQRKPKVMSVESEGTEVAIIGGKGKLES